MDSEAHRTQIFAGEVLRLLGEWYQSRQDSERGGRSPRRLSGAAAPAAHRTTARRFPLYRPRRPL